MSALTLSMLKNKRSKRCIVIGQSQGCTNRQSEVFLTSIIYVYAANVYNVPCVVARLRWRSRKPTQGEVLRKYVTVDKTLLVSRTDSKNTQGSQKYCRTKCRGVSSYLKCPPFTSRVRHQVDTPSTATTVVLCYVSAASSCPL